MGGCTGSTVTGAGIVGSRMALTGIGSIVVPLASVAVTGVAVPIVTGVGGNPASCFMSTTCKSSKKKNTCYNALALLSL